MNNIISVNGGGIRGIVPCYALLELEKQLGGLVRDHISYVAGTSTGALLAACVTAGVPMQDALDVYLKHGGTIFHPTATLPRRINLISNGYMFDNKVLYKVVCDTLGPAAHRTLNEFALDMMMTAVDMGGKRWFMVKDGPKNSNYTGYWPLADCAVASACATTYHGPWIIPGAGFLFDGGTGGLADPVYHTAVEAFEFDTYLPNDTRIINLGTGRYAVHGPYKPPVGLLQNISWVTSSLVSSSKSEAQESVERHWPGVAKLYNPDLSADVDEADVDAIPLLLELGKSFAAGLDWKEMLK